MIHAGWFPSLVFVVHCILFYGFRAYDNAPLLDIPSHFLGGVAIAYFFDVGITYLDRLGIVRVGSRQAALLIVFGLVGTTTVVWELAEFLADVFFKAGAQLGLGDTMKDQFVGIVGGAAYIGLFSGRNQHTPR